MERLLSALWVLASAVLAGYAVYMDQTPASLGMQGVGFLVTTAVVIGCLSMALEILGGFVDTIALFIPKKY